MSNYSIKTVLAIVGLSIALLGLNMMNGQAMAAPTNDDDINTNDFEYSLHITDIIPYYTYQGVSKVLSQGTQSFEDIDTFRFIIQDSNFYAVYNNGYDNTFGFAGIYENGAV